MEHLNISYKLKEITMLFLVKKNLNEILAASHNSVVTW